MLVRIYDLETLVDLAHIYLNNHMYRWPCDSRAEALGMRAGSKESMDQKAATQQGGAGGGGGHKRPGAVEATGGYVNYVLYVLDLALAWFGWFITMCGLSAAQHYVKK